MWSRSELGCSTRGGEEEDEDVCLLAVLFIPITMQTETNCVHIPITYDAFWKVL
jgi:hypothetical protein